jgi:hypothetical protein
MRETVRVLLLEMPLLLRGILEHAIQLRSDCELLKVTNSPLQMLTEQAMAPDVVIMGLTATEDTTLVLSLFARWPGTQVMTVMSAGNDAVIYELKPHRRALRQMSPTEIVDVLRDTVHRNRELSQDGI